MEKISLIIAAYNIESYIIQCMESCIHQTDKHVEVIAVDDGSQDQTTMHLKKFEKEPQVTIIYHDKNKGLSEARKTGYNAASGKYVLFVDGDDWLERHAAECLRTEAEDRKTDILCFLFGLDGESGCRPYEVESFGGGDEKEYLVRLLTGRIPPSLFSKFLRKEYVDKNHVTFPPRLNCGEDVALAASLGLFSPRAELIPKMLYHYRISQGSLSAVPSACMLDILPATRFVEDQLKEKKLYHKYREEYEYYAFLHNLFYRFDAMFTIPNPYRQQLYDNWISLQIQIADNKYFRQNFQEDTPKNQFMKAMAAADSDKSIR